MFCRILPSFKLSGLGIGLCRLRRMIFPKYMYNKRTEFLLLFILFTDSSRFYDLLFWRKWKRKNVYYARGNYSSNFPSYPNISLSKKERKKGINKTRHSLTYTRATLTFTFAGPCKNSGKFAIKETISTGVGSWSKGGTKGRSRYPDIARGNSIPTAFHIYKRGPSFVQRTIFPGRFTSSCTKPNKKERKGRKGRHERNRFEHGYNFVPYLSSWPTVAANPWNELQFSFFFLGRFTSSRKPSKEVGGGRYAETRVWNTNITPEYCHSYWPIVAGDPRGEERFSQKWFISSFKPNVERKEKYQREREIQ